MSVSEIEVPRVEIGPVRRGREPFSARRLLRGIRMNYFYYLLMLPGLIYFLIFHYLPMMGIVIAFKNITPFSGLEGIISQPFVGLYHFQIFFKSYFFKSILANTLIISVMKMAFSFPAPIILALLINEVRLLWFKRIVQTISYMPHFLSMVIVAGLVMAMLSTEGGLINQAIKALGGETHGFLSDPKWFRWILVLTTLWQTIGWNSILYLAAMAGIDPQLYEAAMIDGASRWQQIRHITLPGITYVIIILLIFAVGGLLNAGFEQILLLYSPAVYQVGDIIDTYVYRSGLLSMQYSYATAVGLFKSVLAMAMLLTTNWIAHRLGHEGIW